MSTSTDTTYWDALDVRPVAGGDDRLLVRQFRAFYAELTRLRHQVQGDSRAASGNGIVEADVPPFAEERSTAADVQQQLLSLLNDQEQTVRRKGGEPLQRRRRRVEYAMVALADEVFLNIGWEGRSEWYDHLLESRRFDSQNAGTQVFEMIDDLLSDPSTETEGPVVYLYLLVLGFEGQYRDAADKAPLDDYRSRLYHHVRRRRADRLGEGRALSQKAYHHTLDQGNVQMLPNLRWWLGSLAVVVVLYLVTSTALWWWYTDDVAELAQQILTTP